MSAGSNIAAAQIEQVFGLSAMQEGILLHQSQHPQDRSYVMQSRYVLHGSLDLPALRLAIAEITARHPLLRAGFVHQGLPAPKTVVYKKTAPRLTVYHLEDEHPALEQLFAQERREGFDLRYAPLMKWLVVQTSAQRWEIGKTYHHLITDGYASARVMRELVGAYLHHAKGAPAAAGVGPRAKFSDYVKWSRSLPIERAQAHWRARLSGLPASGRSRSTGPRHLEHCELSLSPELAAALSQWNQRRGCTLAAMLSGVLGLLLRVDGGELAPVVGMVTRWVPESWGEQDFAVGPMIATVPLRLPAIDPDQTWEAYLHEVLAQSFEDRSFAQLSLSQIKALAPRELQGTSLFDVLLVVENHGGGHLDPVKPASTRASELRIEPIGTKDGSEYPLTVYALPGSRPGLRIHADAQHWGAGAAQRWAEAMVAALQELVRPGARVQQTGLSLSRAEMPANRTAPEICDPWLALSRWVQERPEQLALTMAQDDWSYARLYATAKACASFLAAQGVDPEDRVALAGARGPWQVAAILGIWAQGAAFVALDPQGPPQQLVSIAQDANVKGVLCGPEATALPQALPLGEHWGYAQWSAGSREIKLQSTFHPEQLAYLMWTSGSSGRPKGVAVSRGALGRFLFAMRSVIELGPGQRWLSITALGFDISLLELFYPICVGASCVMADSTTAQDGVALARILAHERIDVCQATPSSWQMMLDAGCVAPHLFALCGGEALAATLAQSLASKVRRLVNVYGPTEATIWASAAQLDHPTSKIPVGHPLAGVAIDAVDGHGQFKVGRGELVIGGCTLARGYWGSPRQTALAFRPDPNRRGGRRYHTGDLGYRDLGGALHCLGRLDRQVKIRGHRIDLLGVESAMLQAGMAIKEAAALLVELPGQGPVLLGAYTAQERLDPARLRAAVRQQLPAAAVPVHWVQLDRFPKNDRNKRDDRALAKQVAPRIRSSVSEIRHQDGALASLATQVWIEALGQGGAVDDDFFAQGGHSLIALRMSAKLEPALGHPVPVAWILSHPRRVEWIERLTQGDTARASGPSLEKLGSWPTSFVATPVQKRFWWLETRAETPGHYNLLVALALPDALEEQRLVDALDELCVHHPMLATRLFRREGELYCENVEVRPSDRPEHWGLVTTPANVPLDGLLDEELSYPFELEQRPAWRLRMTMLLDGRCALVFCAHHALLDGRSLELVLSTLAKILFEPDQVALPDWDFASYARWIDRLDQAGELDRQAAFWRERLPQQTLPTYLAYAGDGAGVQAQEQRVAFTLSDSLAQRWRVLNQQQLCTHFMVLLAAMYRWLVPLTGQTHLCVGSPHHGRVDPKLSEVVGPFVSTLAWSLDLGDHPDAKTLIKRVRSLVLQGQHCQLAPLERSYDPTQGRPFAAMLSIQSQSASEPTTVHGEYLARPAAAHKGTLTVYAKLPRKGPIQIELSYDPGVFAADAARELLDRFIAELKSLIEPPRSRMTEPDFRLPALEATPGSIARPQTLMHRFAAQAEQRPLAIALECDEGCFSYSCLWSRAQRLATGLAQSGVCAGDLVAIEFERGVSMVVGILGVLASGAAYLPIEPHWPANRKAELITRSGALGPLCERVSSQSADWVLSQLEADGASIRDLAHRWSPELMAYVMYTSGSTGAPKGVAVSHRNVDALLCAVRTQMSLSPEDCWSCTHSYAFDFSVWELWGAFCSGARVRMMTHTQRKDPAQLLDQLVKGRVSVLSQTPSAFYALAGGAMRERVPAQLQALRYVIFGGEALDHDALEPWRTWQGDGGPTLVDMYGITETTVHVSYQELGAESKAGVGRPLPGMSVALLAADGTTVAPGAVGEILVGGSGVAMGYWKQPRLSAERFVPDPHGLPGQRRYKSGDLGRQRADQTLQHCGRIDAQVQIRGFRVEPAEVAARLRAHPHVDQAVVLVESSAQGRPSGLVGFYTTNDRVDEPTLRAFLESSLPDHLWPQALLSVKTLPRTRNDKVDKRALLAQLAEHRQETAAHGEVHSGLEQIVVQVFCAVLGRSLSPSEDFFAAGGHSLLAVDLVHELSDRIGQPVSVGQLFAHPTPSQLTRALVSASGPAKPRLIALSTQAQRDWVICLHPGGGHLEGYRDLAAALVKCQVQVWGIACPSLDDPGYRAQSVVQIAKDYLALLREAMAEHEVRRVHLLGWSFGAIVAAAMAHRWPSHEATLAGLVMLDPPTPQRPGGLSDPAPRPGWEGFVAAVGLSARDPRLLEMSEVERDVLLKGWNQAHAQARPWAWLAEIVNSKQLVQPPVSARFWEWRYERLVHASQLVANYAAESLAVPVHVWQVDPRGTAPKTPEWIDAPALELNAHRGTHTSIVSDPAIANALVSLLEASPPEQIPQGDV